MPQKAQAARLPAAAAWLSQESSGLLSVRRKVQGKAAQAPGKDPAATGCRCGAAAGPAPVGNTASRSNDGTLLLPQRPARGPARWVSKNKNPLQNSIRKHSTQQKLFNLNV